MAALLSIRSGWEDVVRTPQDDGPSPVVAISYPDECKTDIITTYVFLA